MISGRTSGRRHFLRNTAAVAAGLFSAGLVARCAGTDRDAAAWAAGLDPDLDCSDLSGLWPAEAETRETNEYAARSPRPGEQCFQCAEFRPGRDPRACGACNTVKGPIDPGGWCKSWVENRGWAPPA